MSENESPNLSNEKRQREAADGSSETSQNLEDLPTNKICKTETQGSTTSEQRDQTNKPAIPMCAICMEDESSSITLLPKHNCGQCTEDSWRVCERCDGQLLSRQCPFCQGDYKELMFYKVEGLPTKFPFNFSQYSNTEEKYLATLKAHIFCDIALRSNCVVWSPSNNRMYFSLPKDMSVPKNEMEFILSSIPMTADQLINDGKQFALTNQIWQRIVDEEESNQDSTLLASPKEALKWIVEHGINETSHIMLPFSPADWETLNSEILVDSSSSQS